MFMEEASKKEKSVGGGLIIMDSNIMRNISYAIFNGLRKE